MAVSKTRHVLLLCNFDLENNAAPIEFKLALKTLGCSVFDPDTDYKYPRCGRQFADESSGTAVTCEAAHRCPECKAARLDEFNAQIAQVERTQGFILKVDDSAIDNVEHMLRWHFVPQIEAQADKAASDTATAMLMACSVWDSATSGKSSGKFESPFKAEDFAHVTVTKHAAKLACEMVNATETAVRVVEKFSRQVEAALLFIKAGVIPPIVRVLSEGSFDAKSYAAMALKNLCYNEKSEVEIVAAGAVQPLVSLLTEGTLAGKEHAGALFAELSYNSQNKMIIMLSGAIPALIPNLQKGTAEIKTNAALALFNLSTKNHQVGMEIVASGALPPLVKLLSEGTARAKSRAVTMGVLWNVSCIQDNHPALVEAGVIPKAVGMLASGSTEAKEYAAGLVWNLTGNSRYHADIVAERAIPRLVKLLSGGTDATNAHAAGALYNLSFHEEYHEAILSADAIPALTKVHRHGNLNGKELSAKTCRQLDEFWELDFRAGKI